MAQGEYISPEKIENIYIRSEPVAQLYVHGDSLQVINQETHTAPPCWLLLNRINPHFTCTFQSFLVGIIVPDPEVIPEWAKSKGIVVTFKDMYKNLVGTVAEILQIK